MPDTPWEVASNQQPREWLDSPWVWFGLFAAMGIVALLAVSPKYAQRQGRLEQRYANRLQLEEQRRATSSPNALSKPSPATPTRMSDARAATSLLPIAVVLAGVLAVVATAIWLRSQRRTLARPPVDP